VFATLRRWLGRGERRRHTRARGGSVHIDIDGAELELTDSSPGGFRGGGFQAPPPQRGSFVSGSVRVGRVSGAYTAYVVAIYDDGSIGARFDEIDAAVFRALAQQRG
jgi:hypothetical protein